VGNPIYIDQMMAALPRAIIGSSMVEAWSGVVSSALTNSSLAPVEGRPYKVNA
jgi:hypothetical protein